MQFIKRILQSRERKDFVPLEIYKRLGIAAMPNSLFSAIRPWLTGSIAKRSRIAIHVFHDGNRKIDLIAQVRKKNSGEALDTLPGVYRYKETV